ncbi:uncharacterized protein LOC135961445 [Calliphora vicina]|uniref:uncharacterized protein LOC135961445 n=1 Tax=Calliphora vicina TaxID=7373 RepID=UPI00325B9F02
MSLPRTPPPLEAPTLSQESLCPICNKIMLGNQECMIITNCNHNFHRCCIEQILSNTAECPTCKLPCDLSNLKNHNFNSFNNFPKPSKRGRPRGAMIGRPTTRSQNNQRSLLESSTYDNDEEQARIPTETFPSTPTHSQNLNNRQTSTRNNRRQRNTIDSDQLNNVIENTLTRLLTNLNILPSQHFPINPNLNSHPNERQNNVNLLSNQNFDNFNPNRESYRRNENVYNTVNQPMNGNLNSGSQSFNSFNMNTEKVTSIIQSWNLRFDGSSGLNIEEFLYRVRSLTNDHFNGNFTPICKNLNIILSGKAKDWYWRYHKSVGNINWNDFCEAIQCQYRDFKSSYDIKEELRNRKQKPGETFDSYFDAISSIMDRLPSQVPEMELIEILTRNLRPDIRQEILYIPVHSIPHLRKLVQMRESFLSEEHVRRNLAFRSQNPMVPRRHIAEVSVPDSFDSTDYLNDTSQAEVNAVQSSDRIVSGPKTAGKVAITSENEISSIPNDSDKINHPEKTLLKPDMNVNTNFTLTILKNNVNKCKTEDISKIIYPLLPYHERLQNYIRKRNEIFQNTSVTSIVKPKPKRSTIRLRSHFRMRKMCSKFLISTIINNPTDKRFYAKVNFLSFTEYGLMDTGANICCIGSDLAKTNFTSFPNYYKCRSFVKTADGNSQSVTGWLEVDISFKNQVRNLKLFIIPSITQRLILGIDFWNEFNLIPNIVESVDLVDMSMVKQCHLSENLDKKSDMSFVNKEKSEQKSDEISYPLTAIQQQQLDLIIALFPNFDQQGLGRTKLIKHEIDVGESKPIKQRFYPVSPAVEKLMFAELDRMLALGVIEASQSPWSSPMRLVIKPNKVRLCLDARKLNFVTKKDAYPLPSIEGIFARIPKANIISKLDLKDAYWQIGLTDESKPLTAFTVPGRPLYQFVVMPFGLCNAPQTMCRLIDEIIPPDLRNSVFGYLDDLVIVSEDFQTHLSVLVRVAEQFRKANLTLNITKSKFCVTTVQYLGYVIGNGGIKTDPEKVSAIVNWPVPKNIRQVRGFLGLAGWYRRFIENFSSIVFPITEILSTKKKFVWTPEAQAAFENIKTLLTTAPILVNPDFKKKFYLHCDASNFGIGAVLIQLDDQGQEKPIAFMSKKLNTAQRNYSVTERECLAALEAIKRFRCYLELQEFEVITDHASLVWLMRQPDLTGRLARWVFKLQSFKFNISHRKGKENVVPDALSRSLGEEINALSIPEPEIDINSPYFGDSDYLNLKDKILNEPHKYPDIKVKDKYVYLRTEHYSGNEEQEEKCWKLWIPHRLRKDVITRAHDDPVCSHGGMVKTLELIRRNFFWPGMVKDVRDYVRNCEICKTTKAPNFILKPEMGKQMVSTRPFQKLFIDILGPYPRSRSGYIGLLIVLDHLTKFHWLFPLRKFTSKAIEDYLRQQIFHVYGVPESIVSDNGSQFKANDFNAFLTSYGVKHTYTAVYSPQSNASERVNRSVIAGIRSYLKHDHKMWDEHLSQISCALRNSYHQSIHCSPYHAVFGFDMVTHGSTYELLNNLRLLNEPTYQLSRDDNLKLIRSDLQKHIKAAYDANQKTYNLRARPQNFQTGQIVFRRSFEKSSCEKHFNSKLAPLFIKSRVKEKLGNHYYVLEDCNGKLIGTFHSKDIRP